MKELKFTVLVGGLLWYAFLSESLKYSLKLGP